MEDRGPAMGHGDMWGEDVPIRESEYRVSVVPSPQEDLQ